MTFKKRKYNTKKHNKKRKYNTKKHNKKRKYNTKKLNKKRKLKGGGKRKRNDSSAPSPASTRKQQKTDYLSNVPDRVIGHLLREYFLNPNNPDYQTVHSLNQTAKVFNKNPDISEPLTEKKTIDTKIQELRAALEDEEGDTNATFEFLIDWDYDPTAWRLFIEPPGQLDFYELYQSEKITHDYLDKDRMPSEIKDSMPSKKSNRYIINRLNKAIEASKKRKIESTENDSDDEFPPLDWSD